MIICNVISIILNSALFVGGIIVGIMISVFLSNPDKNNEIDVPKQKNHDVEDESIGLKNEISNLLREAELRDEELIVLKNQLKSLNIHKIEESSGQTYAEESQLSASTNEKQKSILYFSIPSDTKGRFDISNKKDSHDSKCHYSINVISNIHGELSYLSSDKDFRAIDDYSTHLTPVCEILNFENKSNAKKIQMVEKGVVNFENGFWIIDKNKKVKIQFV